MENNENDKQNLENLFKHIKMTSLKLKNAIDRNDMRQVLKFSVDILNTLKAEFKTPSYYNQLFLNVYNELLPLEIYFKEEIKRGRRIKEFYEAVQQCITVLPRLYLMIIVGKIYIDTCPDEKKEIIDEIIKMANGVQNPLRGFYTRYFLLKTLKDKFDDIDSILINLKEMNKLWIRIGHMKHLLGSDVIKVRNELKDIIGENIIRLASIPNINDNIYKNKILLPILKIIIECGDYISQQYLLLSIIDNLPDILNIKCIDIIITSLGQMIDKVDIKEIFIKIMEKLGNFDSSENLNDIKSAELFEKLNGSIENIIEEFQNQGDIDNDILKIIELEVSYLKFIINFGTYEEQNIKIKNINKIITKCYELISKACDGRNLSEEGTKIVFNLLQIILESPLSIFKCKNFPDLMNYLDEKYRSQLSLDILDSLVNKYNIGMINSKDKMESIIEFIRPMVYIEDNKGSEYLLDKSINKICKLVFVPCSKDPFEQIEMLQMLIELLISSTKENEEDLKNKKIILYYYNYINALLLICYSVNEAYLSAINNEENKNKKSKIHKDFCSRYNLDKFDINNIESFNEFYELLIKEIESTLSKLEKVSPDLTFKLYLQSILLLNKIGKNLNNKENKEEEKKEEKNERYEEYILSFINKSLNIFIEGKNNTKNKLEFLINLIGNICYLSIISKDNLLKISGKIEKLGDKIYKKNEQCIFLLNLSKLYYNEINKDSNKLIELLNKTKKTAVYAMTNPENTILFIYILNEYLRYDGIIENFDQIAKVDEINEIIEAINNYLMSLKSENNDKKIISKIENYYKNTLELIKNRKNNTNKESKYFKLFEKINLDNDN